MIVRRIVAELATSHLATSDLVAARRSYADILGLEVAMDGAGAV